MPAGVLRVEPGLIREQHEQPRLQHDRHLRGEEVVVAEGDLVGGSRVVLVHDRDHPPGEQPAERPARVQIVGPQLEIRGREQDLRGAHLTLRQPLLVGPEETALPDGRGRLQLVDRRWAAPELEHPHAPGDRAGGDQHHVLTAGMELGHLRADTIEDVGPERSVLPGDDRGAEFRHHGHGW